MNSTFNLTIRLKYNDQTILLPLHAFKKPEAMCRALVHYNNRAFVSCMTLSNIKKNRVNDP